MWTNESDKAMALSRLKQAIRFADGLDQEEQDHLAEIMRMIEERVPAECFDGLGEFKGSF